VAIPFVAIPRPTKVSAVFQSGVATTGRRAWPELSADAVLVHSAGHAHFEQTSLRDPEKVRLSETALSYAAPALSSALVTRDCDLFAPRRNGRIIGTCFRYLRYASP
jgi:hypothetical protein